MPAMRKQAGRGGKAACIKQRQLRAFCFEKNIDAVELARSAYNWRLLLKTMPCSNTPDVIGPGIVGFSFRLLKEIEPNYDAELHVFELNWSNGDRWHLHFQKLRPKVSAVRSNTAIAVMLQSAPIDKLMPTSCAGIARNPHKCGKELLLQSTVRASPLPM